MAIRDATHLRNVESDDADPAAPTTPGRGRGRGRTLLAAGRNIWRQLTSMRTALVLLFLLALAALPGALLPQWSLNTSKTAQYIIDHPFWGPLLNRLDFFQVFASPWFAAIYLLLFTSLVGCLIPRNWEFIQQLRRPPVAVPRNLQRLPHHASTVSAGPPSEVADRIRRGLRRWRTVSRTEPDGTITVSAEKGYLREVGNLLFHTALLGLLVVIAIGKMVGYEGSVIVDAGSGFCSAPPISYDNFRPGLLVDGTTMTPFCVTVNRFTATYSDTGQASSFRADIVYQTGAAVGTTSWTRRALVVNDPLRMNGQRLYLLGHGYTPHIRITYPNGAVRDYSQPFKPADSLFTSEGAVKITDPPGYPESTRPKNQLAVVGVFAPTAVIRGGVMSSGFPGPRDPGIAVQIYRGNLGMETGRSQSVFAIDTAQVTSGALAKQTRANLKLGQSVSLSDGTRIDFTGYNEWVSLQTSYDPAEFGALIFASLLLLGLVASLTVKRRRVWFRLIPGAAAPVDHRNPDQADDPTEQPTGTTIEVGGLARTDQAGYGAEFPALVALVTDQDSGSPRRR